MRVILIISTFLSIILLTYVGYIDSQIMAAPGTTILQQIACLLQVGASGICTTICFVGLAIVEAMQESRRLPVVAGSAPPRKARWWQDKNNPGRDASHAA